MERIDIRVVVATVAITAAIFHLITNFFEKIKKNNDAIKIQCFVRRYNALYQYEELATTRVQKYIHRYYAIHQHEELAKEALARKLTAVRRIQSHIRIYNSMRQCESLATIRNLACIITIQKFIRRYCMHIAFEKEKRCTLSNTLFLQAKPFIDDPKQLETLEKSNAGLSNVHFIGDSIVLKLTYAKNEERLKKMKQAREICEQNDYTHLTIPLAKVYKNYLIEGCLPIKKNYNQKEQIGLYLEHKELFTEAVKEFIGFLCHCELNDIIDEVKCPRSNFFALIARYDNVTMYVEEGKGKLGLIDLEMFTPTIKTDRSKQCLSACRIAICFFPYHRDEILEFVKDFHQKIGINYPDTFRAELAIARERVLTYFKEEYEDHLKFIKEKNIDLSTPSKIATISDTRKEEIRQAVENAIHKENNGAFDKESTSNISFINCLGANPEEIKKKFNERFSEILDMVTLLMTELIEENIKWKKIKVISYSELLTVRTLYFSYDATRYRNAKERIGSKINMFIFNQTDQEKEMQMRTGLAEIIIHIILKELFKGGEIVYYNPEFGKTGTIRCIYC